MQPCDYGKYLDDIASGFMKSRILHTALTAGVFELLREPVDAVHVAESLGWDARGVRMLLDGLVALDLARKDNGRYTNGPAATACLVEGAQESQRHILIHKGNAWDAWSRLSDSVRTGAAAPRETPDKTPGELRAFILGMADIARYSAPSVFDAVDISGCRRLLDVGGGPGTYAIAALHKNPQLTATVFDLPEVIPIAREQAELAGMSTRMDFTPGDLTSDELGVGYDAVLISNIIHSYSFETNAALVAKAWRALTPGGVLIIKDFLVNTGRTGPPFSLIFALHMLVNTGEGDTYTAEDVAGWTDAAGFPPGALLDLTPQARLWVAKKP